MEAQFKQNRWEAIRTARRCGLLRIAGEVFAQFGFERASMQAIADMCGVTKATVYAHFGSKEDLFQATLEDWLDSLPTPSLATSADTNLHAQLNHVAWELLRSIEHPSSASLSRTLLLTVSVPEVLLERWRQRHRMHRRYLEEVFSRCCDCENPALAASQFLMLVISDPGHGAVPAGATVRALAAVDLFVRAFSKPGCTAGAPCVVEAAHA